ncbi:MAG: threonine synthase [Verrucomicrobia bacterium]|nr:threonine synthase [Verrucomicrobiota bacterium]
MERCLISTLSSQKFPFDALEEFAPNGESLEVQMCVGKIRRGATIWERFADFLPFKNFRADWGLGEGNTPLLASEKLSNYVGVDLLLKNEAANPTGSFKDRGSLPCVLMAKEKEESWTATISTGNMGSSIAAYGARSGVKTMIFIPTYCPEEKVRAMAIHGATIVKVEAPDYGEMKKSVLKLADSLKLRIVSGNGPIRVEGYKFAAFEIFEQMGDVPDFVAVPTSACGHLRGLFKGFRELKEAGLSKKLPRMIIVQAAQNNPLVAAFKQKKKVPIPVAHVKTIATAITTGNPLGGDEILDKAYRYNWLAEEASEAEILHGWHLLGESGFFVEPSSAVSIEAIRKLRASGEIPKNASVVAMLTGSGLKDMGPFLKEPVHCLHSSVSQLEVDIRRYL